MIMKTIKNQLLQNTQCTTFSSIFIKMNIPNAREIKNNINY